MRLSCPPRAPRSPRTCASSSTSEDLFSRDCAQDRGGHRLGAPRGCAATRRSEQARPGEALELAALLPSGRGGGQAGREETAEEGREHFFWLESAQSSARGREPPTRGLGPAALRGSWLVARPDGGRGPDAPTDPFTERAEYGRGLGPQLPEHGASRSRRAEPPREERRIQRLQRVAYFKCRTDLCSGPEAAHVGAQRDPGSMQRLARGHRRAAVSCFS